MPLSNTTVAITINDMQVLHTVAAKAIGFNVRSVCKNEVSLIFSSGAPLYKSNLGTLRALLAPDLQTLYGAFWAENHTFGDTKSTIIELTLYANKQKFIENQ